MERSRERLGLASDQEVVERVIDDAVADRELMEATLALRGKVDIEDVFGNLEPRADASSSRSLRRRSARSCHRGRCGGGEVRFCGDFPERDTAAKGSSPTSSSR
jgi:hypothetical protein